MRYIINYSRAADKGKPVQLTTYAAVIADTPSAAEAAFSAKYPDRVIVMIEAAPDEVAALRRYGMGAWTDEEQAKHKAMLDERYSRLRDEHAEARERVETYTPDEFAAEQEYAARRGSEETQNADGVHVGDIYVSCWGYDQTNYDFYQVIALKGKHTAIIKENAKAEAMCSDYNGFSRPIRDQFRGDEEWIVRTAYDKREGCPQMRDPSLSGRHYMTPAKFGQIFTPTAGA